MNRYASSGTEDFWQLYYGLSPDIREQAKGAYMAWRENENAGHFKRLKGDGDLCSIRVGSNHRAVGVITADAVAWIWIGTKGEFAKIF